MKAKHFNYDIFISHNRADKVWVRNLAERIADEEYNGRKLRPWLDEQILDPGDLKSNDELTTALDRSRLLGLILSPESMASFWVNFEIDYFLKSRDENSIVFILLKDCELPEKIKKINPDLLDFRDIQNFNNNLQLLFNKLKPGLVITTSHAEQKIDDAFSEFLANDPGGFYAEPTKERDNFYNELSKYPIDDAVYEGLAMAAYSRAAMHLFGISQDFQYNYKMLLGECLGLSLLNSNTYRQVAQHFLSLADAADGNSMILFVIARAFSKLAETDIHQVDLSVLLRAISQLDTKTSLSNEEKALEGMFVRIAGKLRNLPLGELFIKTLSEGGTSSKVIAAGAIAIQYEKASSVFYLSEMEKAIKASPQPVAQQNELASRKLLSLLFDLSVDEEFRVQRAVEMAKQDIRSTFPDVDFPYGFFWINRAKDESAYYIFNDPIIGSIEIATIKNMNETALKTSAGKVVCLSEERIVESLFDQCSAFLIPGQSKDSLLCKRLRSKNVPFAMIKPGLMSELNDGDQVMVSEKQITLWRKTRLIV